MNTVHNTIKFICILILLSATHMASAQTDDKSKEVIQQMIQVIGDYDKLKSKKDVQFHYTYDNLAAGKDVSVERLIFDGEHSWATYSEHDRNVLPGQPGVAQQSLVNGKPQLSLEGKFITDQKAIGATIFLREVNSFWFSMIYKLEDEGTNYTYLGPDNLDGVEYEKLSLKYNNAITKKPADDEYILYFNASTHMLDFFYFSLPARGINKPVIKMTMSYEKIDGIYIPTVRKSFGPDPDTGKYKHNGTYTFKDIKFNNGYKAKDFILQGM